MSTPLRSDFEFRCAFCQGECHVVTVGVGGAPGLIHALPTCGTFDRLPPDEFLRQVRLARNQN